MDFLELIVGGIIGTVFSLTGNAVVERYKKNYISFIVTDCLKTKGENYPLLQATIYNTSKSDISASDFIQPLKLILPNKYKWTSFELIDNSCDIKLNNLLYEENELQFQWDLLKKNDFFRFSARIECVNGERISDDDIIKLGRDIPWNNIKIKNSQIKNYNVKRQEAVLRNVKSLFYILTIIVLVIGLGNPFEITSASFSVIVATLLLILYTIILFILIRQGVIKSTRHKIHLESSGIWNQFTEEKY